MSINPQHQQIKTARYRELTNARILKLAESGIACLEITEGVKAEIQRNHLRDARVRFMNRAISAENYRHRVTMVLNHCRSRVSEVWGFRPEVKPQIQSFLRICSKHQDE